MKHSLSYDNRGVMQRGFPGCRAWSSVGWGAGAPATPLPAQGYDGWFCFITTNSSTGRKCCLLANWIKNQVLETCLKEVFLENLGFWPRGGVLASHDCCNEWPQIWSEVVLTNRDWQKFILAIPEARSLERGSRGWRSVVGRAVLSLEDPGENPSLASCSFS